MLGSWQQLVFLHVAVMTATVMLSMMAAVAMLTITKRAARIAALVLLRPCICLRFSSDDLLHRPPAACVHGGEEQQRYPLSPTAQALQHRRAGTEAAHREGCINAHSSATGQFVKGASDYEHKWDVPEAKTELEKQKLALFNDVDAECGAYGAE
eukprot:5289406-Pleurochrysis_carterae.AAC.1